MMVDHPEDYVRQMKEYGADWLSFHLDSTRFVCRTAKAIRKEGMKAGVVLNPSQPVSQLAPAAKYVDYVIFMAVEPGFSGQRFMEGAIERLEQLCEFRRETGLDFKIVIDGGMDYVTAKKCVELGADILVTGIYMQFRQPDGIMGGLRKISKYVWPVEAGWLQGVIPLSGSLILYSLVSMIERNRWYRLSLVRAIGFFI